MAKQSGLHQIRGKVGEHSYYRQTGVTSGLIRSINQGLSSRVKTADEYANTRLNNAEFGQAARIAKVLGMMITPKYRPMILPFSQAIMAKSLLASIKTDSAPWGQRNLSSDASNRIEALIDALNSVSKSDFDGFGIGVSKSQQNEFTFTAFEPLFDTKMESIGATGCVVSVAAASPAIGVFGVNTFEYGKSRARANYYSDELTGGGDSFTLSPTFPPAAPQGAGWMSGNFFIVIVMPFRRINEKDYILQEHCTFKAIAVPE